MNEAPRYASLSSGLLARKGTAKPAMRPQGFNGGFEDLGWNDMGHAPGEAARAEPAPEHVPSSIAALTPAPKLTRTVPDDAESFDEAEQGEQVEAIEATEEVEAIEEIAPAFEAPEEVEAIETIDDLASAFKARAQVDPEEPFQDAEADTFAAPPVVTQQRAIQERFDGEDEPEIAAAVPAQAPRAEVVPLPKRQAATEQRKAAFTLRLDSERHLRLRLACAVSGCSAQQIVARALDEALASLPEIESLASQVPSKPGRAGGVKRN